MIISVANTKGGVGKSTTAVHLATHYARGGKSTLLVDADPQETAFNWAGWRSDDEALIAFSTVKITGQNLRKELLAIAPKYDVVVVDVGGRDSSALRQAITASAEVIIPAGASGFDGSALLDMLGLCTSATELGASFNYRLLFTRIAGNTGSLKEMQRFIAENEIFSTLNVFKTVIHERVAYRRSTENGRVVEEMGDILDEKAVAEMAKFYDEVGGFNDF